MQMMVEEQGEVVTQIESHAQNVETDVEQGVKHIDRAIIIAKSTRAVNNPIFRFPRTSQEKTKYIYFFICRKNGVVSLSLSSLL